MTPEQLDALRTELRTQDTAITADPLFVVFQEERIYGVSQYYQTNGYTWVGVDDSSVTADDDDDEAKVLDKLLDADRELSIGGVTYERVWYRIVPRFVTACLTKKGAEDYIARNGHNLVKPYIYVESMYRNEEMIGLRNHLMCDPCAT
jgi:hypothetical protein